MKSVVIAAVALSAILASCQKEIDWGLNTNNNGDLLIKALQITPSTNDTNTITFKYDGSKRLLEYKSTGKVNGSNTNISDVISRAADGKITRIISKSSLSGGFIDSVVYLPTYAGTRLKYVLDTQYSSLGSIADSTIYTYNGAGQVSEKETFSNVFGSYDPLSKEVYQYDGSGNVTKITSLTADGAGGYDEASVTTVTYNNKRIAVTMGDEAYISLGAENASKNDVIKQVTVSTLLGTTYTTTITAQTYNGYNRPTQASMSLMPQPPGYNLKLKYFYQ